MPIHEASSHLLSLSESHLHYPSPHSQALKVLWTQKKSQTNHFFFSLPCSRFLGTRWLLPSLLSWRVPGPWPPGPHGKGRWSAAAHSLEIQTGIVGEPEPELLLDRQWNPSTSSSRDASTIVSIPWGWRESIILLYVWESNYNCYIDRANHGVRFNLICTGIKSLNLL